jgi:DNA-3-methyladenine glycosylase II
MKSMHSREKFTVKPVPPFDFDLSAKIFSDGDKQIRRYENGRFWQIIEVDGKHILMVVERLGTVDEPELLVELKSNERISISDRKRAEEMVHALFNLELDLSLFYRKTREDKIMTGLASKLRGLKGPSTPTVFEALIDSIVEQQISLNVANRLETRLIKTFGAALNLDENTFYAFPTAQRLASATVQELRTCGLSVRKAEYIRGISKLIAHGKLDLEKFKDYKDAEEIVSELDKIRGVGVWTAELTMVRGMHRLDVLPADDLGLKRLISHFYCKDRKISGQEARRIAEKWGEWKGLASFYLIVAESRNTD